MKQPPDVYFTHEYGRLCENIEDGQCQTFVFSNAFGTVHHVFLKREVPQKLDGITWYDTSTPYGYGGPVVVEASDRERLLETYEKAWMEWCERERIVSEFIRFHPMVRNDQDFGGMYNAVLDRYTMAVDLTDDYEALQFTSHCRTQINKARKLGVVCRIDESCESIDVFRELYEQTMRKNHAHPFYFFSDTYFHAMPRELAEQVFLVNAEWNGRIIASALMMRSKQYAHYHLGATDPKFYGYSAGNLIMQCAMKYACDKGCKWFHLGGGVSRDPADTLLRFKRTFARRESNRKEFWIGRAIRNDRIYRRLVERCCSEARTVQPEGFFPQYRTRG